MFLNLVKSALHNGGVVLVGLYLGGNVFIFCGAALLLGSPAALVFTTLHLPLVDRFIRREERQLEGTFGDEWRSYKVRVRRWI